MAEEIVTLEHKSTWDLVSLPPHVRPSLASGSTRLRPAQMVLLRDIRLVLWLVVFSRSVVVTMTRCLLLWLT